MQRRVKQNPAVPLKQHALKSSAKRGASVLRKQLAQRNQVKTEIIALKKRQLKNPAAARSDYSSQMGIMKKPSFL
jgi:hypothetical protein